MSAIPFAVVILAAGKGTRMKSDLPKVMHPMAGTPMIRILIDQVEQLNPEKVIIVTAPDMDELRSLVKPHVSVTQKQQNGTGDAVKAALPELKDFKGNVVILMGDEPLVPMEVVAEMAAHDSPSAMAILPPDPAGLGRMITDEDGQLVAIIEDKDCNEEQRDILICNAGNYCVPSVKLAEWVSKIGNDNAQNEYYLTDMPKFALEDGVMFDVFTVPIDHVWGINDRRQLAEHERVFQSILRDAHLMNGVNMIDPETVYFQYDTKIGENVLIEPSVFFGPNVRVEDGVHIKAFSHIEGSHIGKNTTVGPFARLRPDTKIGEDVRIGNFVEVKKSDIGNGSKISHLSYVGDTVMQDNVNFSAGAITVNYDGFNKHQTHIGKDVMVGCNVNLIAPVSIDDGAFVAAGSTINTDVPADSLSIARDRGSIHQGWAARFRDKNKK